MYQKADIFSKINQPVKIGNQKEHFIEDIRIRTDE
jgi:hypothetical protein